MTTPMFDFRPAHPGDLKPILYTIGYNPDLPTKAMIAERAETLGFVIHYPKALLKFSLFYLCDLGLVEPKKNRLTDQGKQLLELLEYKGNIFPEVFHALIYSAWHHDWPNKNCFSWTYRKVCQILWNSVSCSINIINLASQLEVSIKQASNEKVFQADDFYTDSLYAVSISSRTVDFGWGILGWLNQLDPPCLFEHNGKLTFERRSFCAPELMLLAIDFIYRQNKIPYASNVLLTDDHRDEICRLCLLRPESFDTVLNLTLSQFDLLRRGVGGGWGTYLLLEREPELRDLK